MGNRIARRTAISRVERLEPRRLLSDVIAVGPEFRVNSFTTNGQHFPSVAMDADGDFVVVWQSNLQELSGYGIYAQRYSAAGVAQGAEFRVNTFTPFDQRFASVAIDADGDFVMAWESNLQDGSGFGIYAQRYSAAGVALGAEFHVNTFTTDLQRVPSVAMDANGDFVVAWESSLQDGSLEGIYAQRYNAAGVAQGAEFRVNSFTTNSQFAASVAMDANGDFVVAWQSNLQDGSGYGIFAQRYNAAGVAQGAEFQINSFTTNGQGHPSVAMDADGDFVVAWQSNLQDGSGYGIYAQTYNAAGVAQGVEFQVNSFTTNGQRFPSVAMDLDGDFVVAWISRYQDGSLEGIYAQRYNAAGVAQGVEFRVNSFTTSFQLDPAVAMDLDGDFVVAWRSPQDGSSYGVYAQRYGVVPEVTGSSFQFATAPHKLSFTFDRDVSASVGTEDLVVQNLTTMQTIPSSDVSVSYDTLTNVATFTYTGTIAGIAGMLPDGNYTSTLIASGISTIQGAPLAVDYALNFQFLQGDADHDGRINLQDFNILAANFGQSPRDFTQGDLDYDTVVNLNDFNILAARFGHVLAASTRSSVFADIQINDVESDRLAELF